MRISLIVPTVGRPDAVRRLLESLARQDCQDFDVVVVDQGRDAGVKKAVEDFQPLVRCAYLPSASRGASRARNEGASRSQGDIFAWPDDDCRYPPDLLGTVARIFSQDPQLDGLLGILLDDEGRPHNRVFGAQPRPLRPRDFFLIGSETVLFARRRAFEAAGGYDEEIGTGAGTPWGAGEATDLGVRALRSGMHWRYCPEVRVYHPNPPVQENDLTQQQKACRYAMGMGAVLRKNRLGAGFVLYYGWVYLRPVIWAVARGRLSLARYHFRRLAGVARGWLAYPARG